MKYKRELSETTIEFQSLFSWILTIVTHGDLDGIVWFQSLFSWILTSEIPDVFNTADHSFQSLFSWILTAPFFRSFSYYSLYPPFL